AEHAFTNHVHERKVAKALESHGGPLACFFICLDYLPRFVERHHYRDFADGVLAVLHRGDADLRMIFPGSAADHAIEIFFFAEILERGPAVAVYMWRWLVRVLHPPFS